MRSQMYQYLSTAMMSILVIASGAIGYQFGQPSSDDSSRQIEDLQQEIDMLTGQVNDLSTYVGREGSWVVEDTEAAYLWVWLVIPASEYQSSGSQNACSGHSNLSPSNLGVAANTTNPVIRPRYGSYLGTFAFSRADWGMDVCVREYFFPNVPHSPDLYFGEWVNANGMNMTSYYWQISWSDIDWEAPIILNA